VNIELTPLEAEVLCGALVLCMARDEASHTFAEMDAIKSAYGKILDAQLASEVRA
jgi:hypothetical protein